MKYLPYIVILILLFLLIFGWLHYSNETGKIEVSNLKEKLDSAKKPHEQEIIRIERERKRAILKIRIDSAKHSQEKEVYRKENLSLRKQLKAVKYTGNPSTVPDDTVKIAMQALLESPIKDSIISVQDKEIVSQGAHIEGLQSNYTSLLDDYQKELNNVNAIADLRKKQVEELEKQNKKLRHKGIWNAVKVGAIALGVGFVIGLSH